MALTHQERKQRLGRGGFARIAEVTKRSAGHVTHVSQHPEARPDKKVMEAITQEIVAKHPDVNPADIWPAT